MEYSQARGIRDKLERQDGAKDDNLFITRCADPFFDHAGLTAQQWRVSRVLDSSWRRTRDDECVLSRRLRTIVQLPEHRRFSVLAQGVELLAENVATLEIDASTLGASRRDRGAAVLRCFAEEEAAKVLILLDLARAGWKDDAVVGACVSRFYVHLARGLYVQAYGGSPADLAEVRRYVDQWRQEYYLDGPMDVDWIFGNEVLASREERLYVDYIEDEHGGRRWTGPADRSAMFDAPFSFPTPASTVVRLVAAMRRIGLLTAVAAGLVLTVPVVSAVMPSGIPNPAATVTAGPSSRERQQDLVSCAGTVALVSSSADRVVVARSQPPPRMTLQVGDILTIDSTGDCESALSATPQTNGVLTVTSVDGYANRFRATSPGTVLVVVTHAACAELAQPNPGCLGGIVGDGSAEIEVVAP